MRSTLEVLFSPAEFLALSKRDLSETVCVVFDVLRATSTMLAALGHGATKIIPVAEISEAVALKRTDPKVLLAGERDGVRILAVLTGGIDFDLGNSPREFTTERVSGRTIVMTTTNGTRALRACAGAKAVLIGSIVGLGALVRWISANRPSKLLLVCAGTLEQASFEDTLAAGALCDAIVPYYQEAQLADSVAIALQVYRDNEADLVRSMEHSRNGRRLLAKAELSGDVAYCLRRDELNLLAEMTQEGTVQLARF